MDSKASPPARTPTRTPNSPHEAVLMATVSDTPEDKKMPLLDHLIELRQRLLYCVVALLVVFGICFYFAQPIFAYLAQPLADVMLEHGIAEHQQIGRPSCRERVCQYVYIPVGAGYLKKK